MGVSWVLLYDWLWYVYFWFSLDTWLSYVHSVTTRVLLRIKQLIMWVLCIHLPSVILHGFFTFTLGLPIIWRAIRLHLSHPRRTKAKVSSSPVTTPHSLSQTLVRSLYHLVLAMFFISMMLCWFLNYLQKWDRLDKWWSPKLCHLYSDFLCVVKDLHTHNVIAIGGSP